MEWINLAHDGEKAVHCFELGNEPLGSIKCREFIDYLSFLRRTLLGGVNLVT